MPVNIITGGRHLIVLRNLSCDRQFSAAVLGGDCDASITGRTKITCYVFHLQKYDNHALVKYLESIGSPFGACQVQPDLHKSKICVLKSSALGAEST